MSQPIGNDPFGNGNATNPFGNGAPGTTAATGKSTDVLGAVGDDIGSAITNAFKGLAGPITTWLGIKEASVINTLNEIINTLYYGTLALVGGLLCAWGLYEVGKDAFNLPGAGGVFNTIKEALPLAALA